VRTVCAYFKVVLHVCVLQVCGLVLGSLAGLQLAAYASLVLCLGWAHQEGPPAAKVALDPLEASLARGKGRHRGPSQKQGKSGRLQQWPPPTSPGRSRTYPSQVRTQYSTVLYGMTGVFMTCPYGHDRGQERKICSLPPVTVQDSTVCRCEITA